MALPVTVPPRTGLTGLPRLTGQPRPNGQHSLERSIADHPAHVAAPSFTATGSDRLQANHLVVVANRLPVSHGPNGWAPSPGGLVSALAPVLGRIGGTWVGWAGADDADPLPERSNSVSLAPVGIGADELEGYYRGFANTVLWPLFHDAVREVDIDPAWWTAYMDVNERFARTTAESAPMSAVVWVHDYHLLLVPGMLRDLRPDLRIGWFCHIPFPPADLFARLPRRDELLAGILGADVIGFQDTRSTNNFFDATERHLDAIVDRTAGVVRLSAVGDSLARTARIGTYPIGIDISLWDSLAADAATDARADEIRSMLGHPEHLLLGVDRLDYTKGIAPRLEAIRTLLRSGRLDPASTVVVQVAVPTRDDTPGYECERSRVERLVGEINGEFSSIGQPVVHYLHRSVSIEELAALYRACDVALVTPLRDGMNLVAKEYVACRTDRTGALVLSEFAGAAQQLTDAVLVNPWDHDALADAIVQAVTLPAEEQHRRMRTMRHVVRREDVHTWAASFLCDLHRSRG